MKYLRSPPLSPSSSQETLRPAKSSVKFLLDDDDDDDEEGLDDALLSPLSAWSSSPVDNGLPQIVYFSNH